MQVLMSGIILPSNVNAEVSDFEITTVICTPTGLKTLSLDDGSTDPGDATEANCEWCQAFANMAPLDRPGTALKIAFSTEPFFYQLTSHQTAADKYSDHVAAIRAPPTLNL